MRIPNAMLSAGLCLCCLTWAATLRAADAKVAVASVPCTQGTYDQQLTRRYQADASGKLPCIGSGEPVMAKLGDWTNQVTASTATFPVRLHLARAELVIERSAADTLAREVTDDASWPGRVTVIQKALDEAIKEVDAILAAGGTEPKDFSVYPALNVDYWKAGGLNGTEPHGVPLRYLADKNCLNATPGPSCPALYTNAIKLADEIFVVDTVVALLHASERSRLLDETKTREDHWHAYLYDTQFQYWWELGLNYWVENRCPFLLRWECSASRTDQYGNELGFREPPQNKLILLHPDLAIEYLHREPEGQKLKPVIAFQWFGYQHWDWSGEGVGHLMGIALVSTVADTSVSKRVGTGVMLQWKRFGLAITGRPKEVGIAINLNVVDWVGSVSPSWEAKLKAPLSQ